MRPHQLQAMTVKQSGWEWTDEGRRKWGWVANSSGSTLDIRVPAVAPHESMRQAGSAGGASKVRENLTLNP
jgi:hypothetical protein